MSQSDVPTCKRGHLLTPQNSYVPQKGGVECKRCRADSQNRYRLKCRNLKRFKSLSRDQVTRIMSALHDGQTLRNITHGVRGRQGYIPGLKICSPQEFAQFRERNRKFDKLVAPLIEANRFRAVRFKVRHIAAPAIFSGDGHKSYNAIMSATRDLPPQIRGDIQGEMFLAVAEGRLRVADIPRRVREFVTLQNRSDRQSVFNPWGHLSLDKPLNGDTDGTLVDIIRDDQRLWG